MTLTLRASRRGDEDRLADGFVRAFRIGDAPALAKYYAENPHLQPEDTIVAEDGGALCAQGTALRLTQMLAGTEIGVAGITLVACAPEHRQKGIVGRIMRRVLADARKRRVPLSGLYPFSEAYYARFGYARVEWTELLDGPPALFARAEASKHVRRLAPERDLPGMRRAYDAWRAGKTGPLVRSEFWWTKRVFPKVKDGVVFAPRGDVRGYALYETNGEPNRIAGELVVRELVHADAEARAALFGWIASLGDQFRRVFLMLPRGEATLTTTRSPAVDVPFFYRFHRAARTVAGEMIRIVRLSDALAAHPSPTRSGEKGTIGLDLEDPVFADQTGAFDLTIDAKGARAKKGRAAKSRLRLGIGALSQIYAGGARARALLDAGSVSGDPRAADLLDAAFAGPAPFLGDLNGY